MAGYGRARFVLLCSVYILKLAKYYNIVIASTISPSGKLGLVVLLKGNSRLIITIFCIDVNI